MQRVVDADVALFWNTLEMKALRMQSNVVMSASGKVLFLQKIERLRESIQKLKRPP